jgi:clan AA aspartic protease (TIGR02281 family)
MRDVGRHKRTVLKETKNLKLEQKKADVYKKAKIQYIQQRRQLNVLIDREKNVSKFNRMVTAFNELGSRIELIDAQLDDNKALKAARGKVNTARETYIEALLKMRRLYDATKEKYADLALDSDVKAAVAEISKALGKPHQIGPTRPFVRNDIALKKVEDTVLSEKITLQANENGVLFVSAVFDGKYTQELAVSTSSSMVYLPFDVAKKLGLDPPADAPTITLELADGRLVDAKRVNIKQLRIGKFIVKDVECAVMPVGFSKGHPALGQSFLRNFNYKIDSDAATLTMTKIETD